MAKGIPLRDDYDGDDLRRLAKLSKDANQTRRLLALAAIYDGGKRGDAARIGGVGLQVIRDWVLRFNERGPDGLIDRKPPGKRPKLNAVQRQELAAIVDMGPIPEIHGVVRWRLDDLVLWVKERWGITMGRAAMGRTLKRMDYAVMTVRPRHRAQDAAALEEFKKNSRRWSRRSATCSRPEPR